MRVPVLVLFAQSALAFEVPDGFKVDRAVDAAHIQFPMFATFDDQGRLFVAESSGLDLYAELTALTRKCQVRLLEDRDGDGKFERAQVFAEKLVYPMGLAWRDGKLFIADPPELITLEDTNGDDKADKRTRILSEFGHKDNGSLHGLIFGPDGWLYMTMGSPDGYKFKRADGSVLQGESGALIRCRPDGSDVEVLARGFDNLVEIVFTPEWEIIGTDNWFRWPEGGVRDALVHLVPGGLYPRQKDTGTPFPITGEPLPAISLYPAIALSGLMRYEGNAFPTDMRGNLFSAQHNSRKVQRHVLVREGSSYRAEDHDFLTTTDPDFHPADVIESPDGSLLVLDTGSWYVQHCPTGRIRNSQSRGGIYRVRYQKTVDKAAPVASDEAALARMGRLSHGRLLALLDGGQPHQRLAAAEALARPDTANCLPQLWTALMKSPDRMVEHALIYAIHHHATTSDLKRALTRTEPRIQAAALLLLDQPPRPAGELAPEIVLQRALSTNAFLRKSAILVLRRHSEWASETRAFLRHELSKPQEPSDELEAMLLDLQKDAGIQELVGNMLANCPSAFLLRLLTRTSLPKTPASWLSAIAQAAKHHDAAIRLAAAHACRISPRLAEPARKLADDPDQPDNIRLAALRAVPSLSTNAVQFATKQLTNASEPLHRFAAAEILRTHKLLPAVEQQPTEAAQKLAGWESVLNTGDAQRGRAIFFSPKTACGTCHAVGSDGGVIGPDLTKVGAIRSGRDILESILFPSSTFAQGYQPFTVTLVDGEELQGVIARDRPDGILLRGASGAETAVRRERVREMKAGEVSLMPSGLEQALSRDEFADLLAYLRSLK